MVPESLEDRFHALESEDQIDVLLQGDQNPAGDSIERAANPT